MDGLYARLVMTEDRPIPHWFLLYGWPHRQTNNASFVTHTIPTQKAYHRDVPTVGQHWSTFDNQSNNNASLIGLVYEISRYKINGQNIWCVELWLRIGNSHYFKSGHIIGNIIGQSLTWGPVSWSSSWRVAPQPEPSFPRAWCDMPWGWAALDWAESGVWAWAVLTSRFPWYPGCCPPGLDSCREREN